MITLIIQFSLKTAKAKYDNWNISFKYSIRYGIENASLLPGLNNRCTNSIPTHFTQTMQFFRSELISNVGQKQQKGQRMKTWKKTSDGISKYLALLAIVVLVWGYLCSYAHSDDTQYWNEFIFEFGLCGRFAAEVALEQQFVDDISEFALYNVTVEPSYKISERLSLGIGYRYEREKDEGDWLTEHRYWPHVTLKHEIGEWKIKLKSKLEFRDLKHDDVWRIRTKLKIQRPLHIASFKITPFLSEEPFYDFSDDRWNQNRAAVGLTTELRKHTDFTIYYMNMAKRSDDDWDSTHIVGTEIVFAF